MIIELWVTLDKKKQVIKKSGKLKNPAVFFILEKIPGTTRYLFLKGTFRTIPLTRKWQHQVNPWKLQLKHINSKKKSPCYAHPLYRFSRRTQFLDTSYIYSPFEIWPLIFLVKFFTRGTTTFGKRPNLNCGNGSLLCIFRPNCKDSGFIS